MKKSKASKAVPNEALLTKWGSLSNEEKLELGLSYKWTSCPPSVGPLPIPPTEQLTETRHNIVYSGDLPLSLAGLGKVPSALSELYLDVEIEAEEDEDYSGRYKEVVRAYLYTIELVTVPNPRYKKELESYERAAAKYTFTLSLLPLYKEWYEIFKEKKAEEQKQVRLSKKMAALQAAEALLRKAGRTVI